MGEVWRARDTRVDRPVALKVLPEDFLEGEERRARFEREAKLLASLNHPGIATLYSFEEIPGSSASDSTARHVLTMELLEGETLREQLRAGSLPPRKAIDVAAQIAQALAAAHEKGIVHRDLKPENVFLTKNDRVKILDFGLAKVWRREEAVENLTEAGTLSLLTEAGTVFGTVSYMSPEQVRGEPVDRRSDIFSFGTILYEMLSGKNPFRRDTSPETMTAILKDEPAALSGKAAGVAPGLSTIVSRCLEKKPDERFQSAADLAFALTSQAQSAAVPVPSRRWKAVGGPALVVGLVIGVVLMRLLSSGRWTQALPEFTRLTFRRGTVMNARFSSDGKSVLYSASWEGQPQRAFSTRPGEPEVPIGPPDALFLAASRNGQLALATRPVWTGWSYRGTLAMSHGGSEAPREVAADVEKADGAADGTILLTRGQFQMSMMAPEQQRDLTWFDWSVPADLTPDGRTVLFLEWGDGVGATKVAFLRPTDGSPAVRLGEGSPAAVSPDGRIALVYRPSPPRLVLVPAGPGEETTLPAGDVRRFAAEHLLYSSAFFPGGKRFVFVAEGADNLERLWVQDVDGGSPQPFGTAENLYNPVVSPDGSSVAAVAESTGRLVVFSASGEVRRRVDLGKESSGPIGWFSDNRSVFLIGPAGNPTRIDRLDTISGLREVWRDLKIQDRAGILRGVFAGNISQDGKTIVTSYLRLLTDLYLVRNVR